MKTHEDRAIEQFRRRLGALLLLRHALAALTVWAFLWGTAVLALRGALSVPRLPLLWGLAAAPLALIPAFLLARRQLPARSAVRAVLDRHGRCGGLLMAGAEVPLGDWRQAVPPPGRPGLRWRGGRAWALFAGGAAFVLLSFALPQALASLGAGPRLEVQREVARLVEQIDTLKEEAVLPPTRADDLKKKLGQVRDEARGKDPVKTLEALDHLQDVANQSAREDAESATRKNEDLGRAEQLAETLRKNGSSFSPKALAEGMNELAALTRKAAAESGMLDKALDKELLDALKAGSLSPEQLKKLGGALRGYKGKLAGKLARLHKVGLIDREALDKFKECGACDCKALVAYLKECDKGCLCDAIANCEMPGRGGVTRGPGAAKLTWKDPSSEKGVKFKEEELPPAALSELEKSKLSGLSTGTPQVTKGGKPAASGALAGAATGGGSASTAVVLPRHRGTVERYFDRPGRPKK
jgi:hypothetical protein